MDYDTLNSFLSQGKEIQSVFGQFADKKAVHAYLIAGEKGTGKKTFAQLLAATLLCSSDSGKPCGICKNCLLAEKREHPDLIIIEPGNPLAPGIKKDRQTIPVEDIREMIRLCSVRSTEGNTHVVLVFAADRMTVQAQNSLLKTLEEPPPDTCIILVADQSGVLLPTVISRCQAIRMKAWDDEYIKQVLMKKNIPHDRILAVVSAAEGSIGRAIELAADEQYWILRQEVYNAFFSNKSRSDVIRISNGWKERKQDADRILDILSHAVTMLAESRFCPEKQIDLSAFQPNWQTFSAKADSGRFVFLTEAITAARNQLQFSVNFQAVIEKLLLSFIGEGNSWQQ